MLAGVGCKDYDDDINKINDRIDELTTGKIADIESQLSSMQTTVESLKALETRIKALEDAQVTDADLQTLRDERLPFDHARIVRYDPVCRRGDQEGDGGSGSLHDR